MNEQVLECIKSRYNIAIKEFVTATIENYNEEDLLVFLKEDLLDKAVLLSIDFVDFKPNSSSNEKTDGLIYGILTVKCVVGGKRYYNGSWIDSKGTVTIRFDIEIWCELSIGLPNRLFIEGYKQYIDISSKN